MHSYRLSPLAAMLLLGLAVLGTACNKSDTDAAKAASAAAATTLARALSQADLLVTAVAPVAEQLPFTATLNPLNSAEVAAQSEGTVLAVLVREGETVQKGQLLARIDAEALRQNVLEMQAQLANDEARLKLARLKRDKQRELYQQGFISKLAFDEIDNDYQIRVGELAARRSQLARAKTSLGETEVRAPMAGTVYARRTQPGEQASKNQKLFAIADLSVLEAAANMPARDIGKLQPGQAARFTVEGLAGEFRGELVRINPVAATATRTFSVYLRVANQDGRLKAGQFAKGGIVQREVLDAVRLPQAAVQQADSASPWVMLVQGGRLVKQPVRIVLRSDSERVLAVQGVAPGQTILAAALLGVKPGDAVTLPKP